MQAYKSLKLSSGQIKEIGGKVKFDDSQTDDEMSEMFQTMLQSNFSDLKVR